MPAMRTSLLHVSLVALGGAIGSVLRFLGSGLVHSLVPGLLFPVGTLAVNVCGSLIIGLVGGFADSRHFLVPGLRLFLFTGLLGRFTTFSAFAFESLGLALDAAWPRFVLNVAAQVLPGLGAAWAGWALARVL